MLQPCGYFFSVSCRLCAGFWLWLMMVSAVTSSIPGQQACCCRHWICSCVTLLAVWLLRKTAAEVPGLCS